MGGLTQPKGGAVKTTTQQTTVPQYVQDAQTNTLNAAQTVTGGVLGSAPQYTQAGINSDQSGAYDLIRQMAMSASNSNAPTIGSTNYTPSLVGPANGYTAQGYTAQNYAPTYAGNGQGYAFAGSGGAATYDPRIAGNSQSYDAALGSAAQTGANDYQQFMNPFIQSVIDPAVANMRQQHDNTSSQIGAQAAAAGSFGGSREALRQGQNDRALGEQVSQLVPQLMSQGYTQAQQEAQANTQLRQQTDLSNQAARNAAMQYDANADDTMARSNASMINQAGQFNAGNIQADRQFNSNAANTAAQFLANANNNMAEFNAGASNAAGQYNTGANNTAAQFGASANNTAAQFLANAQNTNDQFNAGAQNTAGQFGANLALQRAQIQDALSSSDQTRRMQAIQALLGIGNAQQTLEQSYLNQPLQYLQALAATTPQQYSSSTVGTAPNTAQSPLQAILGTAVTLGSAALKGG